MSIRTGVVSETAPIDHRYLAAVFLVEPRPYRFALVDANPVTGCIVTGISYLVCNVTSLVDLLNPECNLIVANALRTIVVDRPEAALTVTVLLVTLDTI